MHCIDFCMFTFFFSHFFKCDAISALIESKLKQLNEQEKKTTNSFQLNEMFSFL